MRVKGIICNIFLAVCVKTLFSVCISLFFITVFAVFEMFQQPKTLMFDVLMRLRTARPSRTDFIYKQTHPCIVLPIKAKNVLMLDVYWKLM